MLVRSGLGIAFALAAAFNYGLSPPLTRLAFQNGVPALENTLVRTLALLLAFGAVAAFTRLPLHIPKAARGALAAMTVATAAISICYLLAVQFIPVSLAVIIFFTFPIIILVLAPVLEGAPVGPVRLLIGFMAFGGLVLAIGPQFKSLDWRGILLAAVASASATMQFFSGRRLSAHMPPVAFGLLVHALLLPVAVGLALWWGQGRLSLTGGGVTAAGFMAVGLVACSYIAGYFCHMRCLALAPASLVAPFFNLEPVTSVVAAALLLDEVPQYNQLAGGAIVLAALVAAGLQGLNARRLSRRPA